MESEKKQLMMQVESLRKEINSHSEKNVETTARVKSLEASRGVQERERVAKRKRSVTIEDHLVGGKNAKVAKRRGESGEQGKEGCPVTSTFVAVFIRSS